MKPTYKNDLLKSFENVEPKEVLPTFEIDWENNRLLSRKVEGEDAVRQNIKSILAVEYQDFIVMPDWFGLAMKDMYGMPRPFVKANLERLIKEALSTYQIIKKIYDVEIYDIDNYSIGIDITVELVDGTSFPMNLEVEHHV